MHIRGLDLYYAYIRTFLNNRGVCISGGWICTMHTLEHFLITGVYAYQGVGLEGFHCTHT